MELLSLCTAENPRHYSMGIPYPPESPILWIKYGRPVLWNEVPAQVMAYHELRLLRSPARAPAIYYACTIEYKTYIVMEYIPGKTAAQLLEVPGKTAVELRKGISDPAKREAIFRLVALGIHELHRIPVPPRSRPTAMDGGLIRHGLFDEQEAPRHYQTIDQLEEHLNLFLKITRRKQRVERLAEEPMVFCFSDLWLGNFIIDDQNRVVVIDFGDVSVLPSSFSKFALLPSQNDYPIDISSWVKVPSTDDVDNTEALCAIAGPMMVGSSSFESIGQRIAGARWQPTD
ncbi:hypothetical protein FQN49_001375 [Arthroderma sp. PD_2]|nr:hypothetical protein FQN49_001375 [Arthroderma sp. PD_2]